MNNEPVKPFIHICRPVQQGLIKVAMKVLAFQPFDAEGLHWEGVTPRPIPAPFVSAVRTAFTLQLLCLFQEGLEYYWQQALGSNPPPLGTMVNKLADKGYLRAPDEVKALVRLRNRLAHEAEAEASWHDWDEAHARVSSELRHLGVIP